MYNDVLRQDILAGQPCPPKYEANLLELLIRINKVGDACGFKLIVTSGFRTMEHHLAIYKKMGIPSNKIPLTSKHLYCQAVDIYDYDGKLYEWCEAHQDLLREIGVWCEIKDDQKRVHFQIVPFKSYRPGGTIFFKP